MNSMLPFLLLLAGCSMPPYAKETIVTEVSPESEHIPEIIHLPPEHKPKAKPKHEARPAPKADDLCPPPAKTETEQERIIRKLDCLLER